MGKEVKAIQCKRCLKVLGLYPSRDEEVEKHFENIHCLKCGKELLEEDSA